MILNKYANIIILAGAMRLMDNKEQRFYRYFWGNNTEKRAKKEKNAGKKKKKLKNICLF